MRKIVFMLVILGILVTNLSGCLFLVGSFVNGVVSGVQSGMIDSFTDEEKSELMSSCGFELPFLAGTTYTLSRYNDGYLYIAEDVFSSEYREFLAVFDQRFSRFKECKDIYGNDFYTYYHNGWKMDIGTWYVGLASSDICVYLYPASYNVEGVQSNYGAGLPRGEDGILNLDFSNLENNTLKDMSNNKYACPSVGNVNVLVLPVCFKGESVSQSNVRNFDTLLNGKESLSVSGFLKSSSFGKMNVTFDVYDGWLCAPYSANEYLAYFEENSYDPTPMNEILLTALTEIEPKMDLTKYDSDSDGYIDAVVMINTLDVAADNLLQWAYKSQNIITNVVGDNYSFDEKKVANYVWISEDFLEDERGNPDITVLLHEFMHTMGVIDYYSTDYLFADDPVYGKDLMSDAFMDNSPFTKLSLGWITEADLVTDFSKAEKKLGNYWATGDMLILANDFDKNLGCFQEYYIVIYSAGSDVFDDGLVFYHIDASLYIGMDFNQPIKLVYNDNDSPIGLGSSDNLVELLKFAGEISLPLHEGEYYSLETLDNKFKKININFKVDLLDTDVVALSFY